MDKLELCFFNDEHSRLTAMKVIDMVNYLKNISPIETLKNVFMHGELVGINITLSQAAEYWRETTNRENMNMPYIEEDIHTMFNVYFEI